MKHFVKHLVIAAGLLGVATTAFAADMPLKAPPVAYLAPFTWSGFYVGVNAGYGSLDTNTITGQPVGLFVAPPPPFIIPGNGLPVGLALRDQGFTGGGQAGVNWQFGSLVTGIEGDINYMGRKSQQIFVQQVIPGFTVFTEERSKLDWLATIRGRLGFAFDRALIYGTGGLALGDTTSYGGVWSNLTAPALQPSGVGTSSRTSVGYSVGAGAEYAFTNNLTLKAEGLYYNLGGDSVLVAGRGNPGPAALQPTDYFILQFKNSGYIGRLGLNYRFGGPAAVVAKY
jgi:outer membrane immunogenic protein